MKNDNNKLTVSISFKIPSSLNQKINEDVVLKGKGFRGKGQWIREAIESFLRLENFPELVALTEGFEDADYTMTAKLPLDLAKKVDQAIIPIRQEYPDIEGVKSKIFRAAIFQRFIRSI